MTRHDDTARLRHMLDHRREAVAILAGRTRSDLDTDRLLDLSVVRLPEIVGEAAARMTPEIRDKLANLPWAEIVGLRSRVIHGYDEVDFDIVWETVTADLPPVLAAIERHLAATSSQG